MNCTPKSGGMQLDFGWGTTLFGNHELSVVTTIERRNKSAAEEGRRREMIRGELSLF